MIRARDDLRRRPRRTHASADRRDAQAAAARRRQDADRAWHLEKLAAAGVRDVVINTSHLAEQFPAALGDGARWGVQHPLQLRRPQPLETGGGIRHALPLLGAAPFIGVAADIVSDYDYATLPARAATRLRISSWCRTRRFIRAAISGSTARGSTRMAPASG